MKIGKLSIWISTLLNSATGFFSLVIIARAIGPAEYGALTTYLALVSIFFPVATLGTQLFALQSRWHNSDYDYGRAIFKICIHSVTATIVIYIVSILILDGAQNNIYWSSLSLLILGQALCDLAFSWVQSKEFYFNASLVVLGQNLIRFITVLCLSLWGFADLNKYVDGLLIASVISILITLKASGVHKLFPRALSDLRLNKESFEMIKKSSRYMMDGLCYLLYYQIYIFVLAGVVNEESVGNFNSGYVILNATYIFPAIFFQKIAQIHIFDVMDMGAEALRKKIKGYIIFSVGSGVAFALPLSIFSPEVTDFIYGGKFPNASAFLSLISLAIPFRFATTCISAFLNRVDCINVKMKISILTLVIGSVLSFVSVTIFGEKGVAYSLLLTEIFWLLMLSISLKSMLRYEYQR